MANTPTTTMRLDPELKDEALQILKPLGLNLTSATNIFLKAVVREKGLPFGQWCGNEENRTIRQIDRPLGNSNSLGSEDGSGATEKGMHSNGAHRRSSSQFSRNNP